MLAGALLICSLSAQASILWSSPGTTLVCNNGQGEDILHGAIKPQDSNSTSTLYFRFRVDPVADSATKSIAPYDGGFVFFEHGEEHVGLGNSWDAWAYSALNVTNSKKGYVDLNSATPEPGFTWEYMRMGVPKYIAFKVQFVPGHDARITAWLNPDLSLGATEINQATNIITRFEAKATFDEIHLIHRGGRGGWKFSQMVAATTFEDLLFAHFWQRGWFLTVTGGGSLVVAAGVAQVFERRRAQRKIRRLEQERAVAAERARIARDIHDELGASLTKIHKLAEMMVRNKPEEDNKFSKTISNTARDTIQTMDEIVWAVNPKNDTLKEMADYLVFFTEDFLRPSGIACCLEVPLNLPGIPVTAEVRHNVFMVVKEALNNAVKHAAAGQIRFGLDHDANKLEIEIADNGRGFRRDETTAVGNGLENMRRRMSGIGGELNIQSEPGKGTTVRLQALLRAGKIPVS
ncbi:MAG: Integral rane sensor signal transduction histidine kinase [Pedosphaera sp.]|nr:Integral rane sensor signal transduction histidine kinase [Pedosphaera sp.]